MFILRRVTRIIKPARVQPPLKCFDAFLPYALAGNVRFGAAAAASNLSAVECFLMTDP